MNTRKQGDYDYRAAVEFIRANDRYREVCHAQRATVTDALDLAMARAKLVRR